ncbi:TPA_asm: hypothetical protein GIH59_12655 [Listeria monocytogenes]|nr:hypothetical protein [Listeria monocytogenes]
MTSRKHEKAFPKSFQTEVPLTPEEAKLLFPHKIRSNRDFICATTNCSAPITCMCIDSLKTASFIEGRRSENLHADHCPFSLRTIQTIEPVSQDQQFEVKDTGKAEGTYINKQNVELPIRSRFRHNRTFQEPLPEDNRFIIVYGRAHLIKVNHPLCYQIRFEDIIEINNHSIRPTFLITKEWIQKKYPFLLPRKDKSNPFMAYIRKFPVLIQSKFINFKFEEEYNRKLGYFISPEEQMKGNTHFTPIS